MKLIINIPEDYYEIIKHHVDNHQLDYRPFEIIANGTPLDDVKDEIDKAYHDLPRYYPFALNTFAIIVDEILDSIGKAESEDKE